MKKITLKKSDLETINITEDNYFELTFPNRNDEKQLFPKGKKMIDNENCEKFVQMSRSQSHGFWCNG